MPAIFKHHRCSAATADAVMRPETPKSSPLHLDMHAMMDAHQLFGFCHTSRNSATDIPNNSTDIDDSLISQFRYSQKAMRQ
jgi:hypothetical protein